MNLNNKIKPSVIGILNVTPDSFSDGSSYYGLQKAINRAIEIESEGASIIDIGGESTRPGAKRVDLKEEKDRVIPLVKKLKGLLKIPISIDTYKSEIAEEAIFNGVSIVNDISALRFDTKMVDLLKKFSSVKIILMHMQGTPDSMQKEPFYNDVIKEIVDFFIERISFCKNHQINTDRIILDPGIGFGKRFEDNISILKNIGKIKQLGFPVLIGTSRKSFINNIYPSKISERLAGTLATTASAYWSKTDYIRVHDVKENINFLKTISTIEDFV